MKVKEIGNLTADPKYGEKDDIKYCNFDIAINDPFGNEETEYAHVSVFGKQAENCRDSLMKGSQVCVEGNVKANAYLDNEGKPKAGLNVTAKEVMFLNRTKIRENNDEHSTIDKAMRKSEQNYSIPGSGQAAR